MRKSCFKVMLKVVTCACEIASALLQACHKVLCMSGRLIWGYFPHQWPVHISTLRTPCLLLNVVK